MIWLLLAYLAVGYWYFCQTLKYIEVWDTTDTILINAALAITVGPLLLGGAMLFDRISRIIEWTPGYGSHL